jgi:DNA primase
MISKQSIENLKNHIDIVEVISSYLPLKKNGANFKACCPFHGEKTPSFIVSPQKQIYHCFGCHAGGDALKFVIEFEKISYIEAIEKLAFMLNFSLEYETKDQNNKFDSKVLDEINHFFKLNFEKNDTAKNYLKNRGVFESLIEKFEIGYAPTSKELISYIKNNFLNILNAKELGVVENGENGYYSRFVDRIIFPIYSQNNKIVGFGGRTLGSHQAKYINSPQTILFNKSKLLYGYNLAKTEIYKKNEIIVTEGYLDVIMLHQAGFCNAVATLGTALTNEHLPLLKKGEPKVILAYDGDNAGITAALKASTLLSQNNIFGGVVIFENGLDPADMVNSNQINELEQLFASPTPFINFVINKIAQKSNLSLPLEKKKAIEETKNYLASLDQVIAEEYRIFASSVFGINSKYLQIATFEKNKIKKIEQKEFDLAELQIIKTMARIPSLIDFVLDIVNEEMFESHREEFFEIQQNNLDSPKIISILLDDEIKTFDENELKHQLIVFLINFYNKELISINSNQALDYKKKVIQVQKIKHNIQKLKKGELGLHN